MPFRQHPETPVRVLAHNPKTPSFLDSAHIKWPSHTASRGHVCLRATAHRNPRLSRICTSSFSKQRNVYLLKEKAGKRTKNSQRLSVTPPLSKARSSFIQKNKSKRHQAKAPGQGCWLRGFPGMPWSMSAPPGFHFLQDTSGVTFPCLPLRCPL